MKRLLTKLTIAGVVLGASGAAANLVGEDYIAGRIETALQRLSDAGVEVAYQDIAVTGYPIPDRGVVTGLDVYMPELGVRFALREVASDISITALDAFAFDLPDTLVLDLTDRNGAPTGDTIIIAGSEMAAVLTATEQGVYDFGFTAAEARISGGSGDEARGDAALLGGVDMAARVAIDDFAQTAVADVAIAVDRFQPGRMESPTQMAPLSAVAEGAALRFELGSESVEVALSVDEFQLPTEAFQCGAGAATVSDISAALSLTAASELDLSPLFDAASLENAAEGMIIVAQQTLFDGGRVDHAAGVGGACIEPTERGAPFSRIEVSNAGYDIDFAPEVIGFAIEVDALEVDGPQSPGDDLSVALTDFDISLAFNAGARGFNFSTLSDPDAFARNFLGQFRRGGDAAFRTGLGDLTLTVRDDQSGPVSFTASDVALTAGLNADRVGVEFGLGSIVVDPKLMRCGPVESGRLEGFTTAVSLTAGEPMAFDLLADVGNERELERALAEIVGGAIISGGRVDHSMSLDTICLQPTEEIATDLLFDTLEIDDAGYTVEFSPEAMQATVAVDRVKFEGREIDWETYFNQQSGDGSQDFSEALPTKLYSVEINAADLVVGVIAGANGFDFATIPEGDAFLFNIIDQFEQGGSAIISYTAGRSVQTEERPIFLPGVDLATVSTRENSLTISLNQEAFVLDLSYVGLSAELFGEITGVNTLDSFELFVSAPVSASDAPQTAPIRFSIVDLSLSDDVWRLLDPTDVLEHEASRLAIALDVGYVARVSLFDDPERFFAELGLSSLTIEEIHIAALGAEIAAEGEITFDALLPADAAVQSGRGEVEVRLIGWRQLLDGLARHPAIEGQRAAEGFAALGNAIDGVGVDGGEGDEKIFNIVISGQTILVNGETLDDIGRRYAP